MRKTRLVIIILAVMLIISISRNIINVRNNARDNDFFRQSLINDTYSNLRNITMTLDGLWNVTDIEQSRFAFEMLAILFAKQDYIISAHSLYFTEINQPGRFILGDISRTFTSGSSRINNIDIHGILRDGIISEIEAQYMAILLEDVQTMLDGMVSTDGLNANQNLTVHQFSRILNEFYSKWRITGTDSTFLLLRAD